MLAWLGRVLPGDRVVAAQRLGGGYSNENVLVTTARGRYVLRRYPARAGRDTARTCAVEAALAARLAGTAVPVPEVIAADPGGAAAGSRCCWPGTRPASRSARCSARGPGRPPGSARRPAARWPPIGSVTFERGGMFTGADLVPSAAGLPASLPEFVEACLRAGPAATALSPAELGGLRALAAAAEPLAASVADARQLVHSDYNGKNLLAVRRRGRWSISAVLDWEFAFSGSPLVDIGNMLRLRREYPPGFGDGFIGGYRDAGGPLPPDWREVSEALDLYALADLLTRPPGHRYFGQAVSVIRERLAVGPGRSPRRSGNEYTPGYLG